MRASNLSILFIAAIAGLAVTAVGRSLGFFESDKPAEKQPPAKVLVAARTIFKGNMVEVANVTTRDVSSSEANDYAVNASQYLPAIPEVVYQRIAARNIEAGQVLKRIDLEELSKPEALGTRLLPQMRAISVSVSRDRSAGALIQTGEWVDVYLTTSFSVGKVQESRTVMLARNARVLTRRNSLWPVYRPIPEDQPMDYVVELNPYRAALVEFARNYGTFSLVPIAEKEQLALEKSRTAAMKSNSPLTFNNPKSVELANEDERIAAFNSGDLTLSEEDLHRILAIKHPEMPDPSKPPREVEVLYGDDRERHSFDGHHVSVTVSRRTNVVAPPKPEPEPNPDDFAIKFDRNSAESQAKSVSKSSRPNSPQTKASLKETQGKAGKAPPAQGR